MKNKKRINISKLTEIYLGKKNLMKNIYKQ